MTKEMHNFQCWFCGVILKYFILTVNKNTPKHKRNQGRKCVLFNDALHDWCNKGHGMCYPVCYDT